MQNSTGNELPQNVLNHASESSSTDAASEARVSFTWFTSITDNIGKGGDDTFDALERYIAWACNEHTFPNYWPDAAKHKQAKGQLPYFTACTFNGRRSRANAQLASVLVLDLDGVTDEELAEHFETVRKLAVRAFAYGSPSDGLKEGRCVRIVFALDRTIGPVEFDFALKALVHTARFKNDARTEKIEHPFFVGRPDGAPPRQFWTFPGAPAPADELARDGIALGEKGLIRPRGLPAEDVPDEAIDALPDGAPSQLEAFAAFLRARPPKLTNGEPHNARYVYCCEGARLGLNRSQIESAMREHYLPRHTNVETTESQLRKMARNALKHAQREREAERAETERFHRDLHNMQSVPTSAKDWIKNGATAFDERPPIAYLIPELGIAPGPPTMVVALGYSGKSLLLLSLLLSVASQTVVWGMFKVDRPGRSIFLDYEGPDVLLQDRLQRLAIGMGLGREVAGMIDHGRPPTYLDGQREPVRAWLVETLTGYTAAVIDSFRVACPTLDENDSRAAIPLDLLAEVSEITGCVVFVIHHASKGSKDEDDAVNPRGSTSLFNACGTVLTLSSKDPEGPKRVQHTKAKFARRPQPPFMVRIEDLPAVDGLEPVRVVALNKTAHEARELSQNEQRILKALRDHGPFETVDASCKQDTARGRLMRACNMGDKPFAAAFDSLSKRSEGFPWSEGMLETGKGKDRRITYRPSTGPAVNVGQVHLVPVGG
jgi:hypothetical protein